MTKLGWVVRRGLAVSTAILMPLTAAAQVADEPAYTVLTGIQATYSLTSALTNGTSIQVVNVPEDGRQMSLLTDYARISDFAVVPYPPDQSSRPEFAGLRREKPHHGG